MFSSDVRLPISGISSLVENILFLRFVELRSRVELLLALHADTAHQDIPVILMSVMPRSSMPQDCKPAAFLRKPFEIDQLLAEVGRLLTPG